MIPDKWREAVEANKIEFSCDTVGVFGATEKADLLACFPTVDQFIPIDEMHAACGKVLFAVLPDLPIDRAEAWQKHIGSKFQIREWFQFPGEGIICAALPQFNTPWTVSNAPGTVETRHAQMRANSAAIQARIPAMPIAAHKRICALVCYGPSLHQTWMALPGLRKYKNATVVTVSGAHDFLLKRTDAPHIHVECDAREHKAKFTENPQKGIKYLAASCCHPKLIDQLKGYDLALWHMHNGDEDLKLIREIDPDQQLIIGGGSVGLRAIFLMFYLGYREFSIFGMDCSFAEGQTHAGSHPGKKHEIIDARCGDRWFKSSPIMTVYAKQFMELMHVIPDATFELYGDGLLQHMCKLAFKPKRAA